MKVNFSDDTFSDVIPTALLLCVVLNPMKRVFDDKLSSFILILALSPFNP